MTKRPPNLGQGFVARLDVSTVGFLVCRTDDTFKGRLGSLGCHPKANILPFQIKYIIPIEKAPRALHFLGIEGGHTFFEGGS
jgi:hypothetical protein